MSSSSKICKFTSHDKKYLRNILISYAAREKDSEVRRGIGISQTPDFFYFSFLNLKKMAIDTLALNLEYG